MTFGFYLSICPLVDLYLAYNVEMCLAKIVLRVALFGLVFGLIEVWSSPLIQGILRSTSGRNRF